MLSHIQSRRQITVTIMKNSIVIAFLTTFLSADSKPDVVADMISKFSAGSAGDSILMNNFAVRGAFDLTYFWHTLSYETAENQPYALKK